MRINRNKIKKGYATSISFSPYNSNIDDWAEPLIKPLVQTLLNKNYMTISSCQGHSIKDDCYIYIAFGTENNSAKEAFKLQEQLFPLVQFGITSRIIRAEDYMEQTEDYSESFKNIPDLRRKGVFVRTKMSKEEAANCINNLFKRGYSRYYLLKIYLSKGSDRVSWWQACKNYFLYRKRNIKIANEFIKNNVGFYEG